MMDAMHQEIQNLFIEGVNEVFYTLFNDGENEGVYFFPQVEQEKNVYQEEKGKVYGNPALLVSRVQLNPVQGEENIQTIRCDALFTVPYMSLRDRGIDVSENNLVNLRKGLMKYKDTYYTIENIKPHAFVEQTFLLYDFICKEQIFSDLDEIEFLFTEEFDESADISTEEEEDEQ